MSSRRDDHPRVFVAPRGGKSIFHTDLETCRLPPDNPTTWTLTAARRWNLRRCSYCPPLEAVEADTDTDAEAVDDA